MVRVLLYIGSLNIGGSQMMVMNILRCIDRNKIIFDFVVDCEEYQLASEILSMGGKIYNCPKYNFRNHLAYKQWWKKFFDEHPEYKIVHSHVRSTASIVLKVAKQKGRKTISHSHSTSNGSGIKAFLKKILQKSIPKYSDYCFACSIESGKWLFGKKVVESNKFKVIPNAIDIRKFQFCADLRQRIRREYSLENDFVIGHVGRFSSMKNHQFLLEIFKKFQEEIPNSKLCLVGTGELQEIIKNKVVEYGLQEKVMFLGARSNVYELLNAFDCFVFPSIWEGLPVSLVEAQANGLPIVASENITDEVIMTDLVKKVSLNQGIERWVQVIKATERSKDEMIQASIARTGYSIVESTAWLQNFYIEQSKE